MIELSKEQWKALEKQYSKCLRTIFRPPLWAVEQGMMGSVKYEMTLNEISILEGERSNMRYVGTSICEDDGDYVEYYLSNDDKLYTYLYKEKLEFIDGEEDVDVIHTGEFLCELICVNESDEVDGVA